MSDFVDLTCPSCGDTLQLPTGGLRTVCRSCGREFAARPQANGAPLVTFGCCPICGQNDRVEKLAAIVTGQASVLAQRLAPPSEPPREAPKQSFDFQVVYAAAIALGVLWLYVWLINKEVGIALLCGLPPMVGGILALVLGKRQLEARQTAEAAQAKAAHDAWQHAMARWDQAYYCGRDDCVFIPGEPAGYPSHALARLMYTR